MSRVYKYIVERECVIDLNPDEHGWRHIDQDFSY